VEATREQLRLYVREFGADGLTEAQNFFPAIPRLPIKAQMAVMRVLIDEFGCGNLGQAHSFIYAQLLAELDLPTDLDSLVETTSEHTFAFINSFFWLAQRAPGPEYFLGGLAYLEASIPAAFTHLARACERLGIDGKYYSEHVHIDEFHTEELRRAVRELEVARGLNPQWLWAGSLMVSDLLGIAVDSVVARMRTDVAPTPGAAGAVAHV
jgi:hypothetical protein